jgi:RND family efflux transporter MFP subunit
MRFLLVAALLTANAAHAQDPGNMSCVVEPRLVTQVGSPVDGLIEQVMVDRGDVVSAGQVVAKLRSAVEEAEMAVRQAKVEAGKRKIERIDELFKKQLISEQEKDEIETEYRVNLAELKRDTENVRLRTIVSPVTGVVVERYLAAGELIRADKSKIVKLAQIDPLNVEVVAPVGMFGKVARGDVAEVSLEPQVKGTFTARVVVIDRVIDAASSTFGVRLELRNPGNRIPAGLRCRVKFKGS